MSDGLKASHSFRLCYEASILYIIEFQPMKSILPY
jgi:hypothetical protein